MSSHHVSFCSHQLEAVSSFPNRTLMIKLGITTSTVKLVKAPDLSAIITGADGVLLYFCPGSHHFLFYPADVNESPYQNITMKHYAGLSHHQPWLCTARWGGVERLELLSRSVVPHSVRWKCQGWY